MTNINLQPLQEEVMDRWEENLIRFIDEEDRVMPEFNLILEDPMACINELGFVKLSDYISERSQQCN